MQEKPQETQEHTVYELEGRYGENCSQLAQLRKAIREKNKRPMVQKD